MIDIQLKGGFPMKNQQDLINCISNNPELMTILTIVEELHLPQACLCAGTIRSTIWNHLSTKKNHLSNDLDIIFFAPDVSYESTLLIQDQLQKMYPFYQWELRNQCDMHRHNPNTLPYRSVEDAISKFPETCTAIGIRMKNETLELIAPYGISDLIHFKVVPTPYYQADPKRMAIYKQRVYQKAWQEIWPNVTLYWE